MTPQNSSPEESRKRGILGNSLFSLSLIAGPLALGLLGMMVQAPLLPDQLNRPLEAQFMDGPQPKPAADNRAMRMLLRQEYLLYQRQSAQKHLSASRRWALVCEAVDAYNEVASDTDPSAFRHTMLPRHLSYPSRPSVFSRAQTFSARSRVAAE